MRIDRYISNSRIIDLSSRDLKSAYSELLQTFSSQLVSPVIRKKVLKELVDREKSLTSYIGEGVALPHARVSMKRPYALAVGRCQLDFLLKEGTAMKIFDLFLCFWLAKKPKLPFFPSRFSSFFSGQFSHGPTLDGQGQKEFKAAVRNAFAETDDRPARRRTKFNKLLTDEAAKIAKAAECSTILVFTDVFPCPSTPYDFSNFKVVLAGEDVSDEDRIHHRADATLAVRALSGSRLSQLRAAILLGLTRGIFGFQIAFVALAEFLTVANSIPSWLLMLMKNLNP